ncbi:hypothetical protein [Vulcanisaeta souniana]|uniref:Uncharacterized protein n=1 Tax=Vulcanisaeta souniana JCM 11219 TaxID=1293586 RepID=A0A830EBZ0_9CREN|nr:hypothetical protein [Vulcanisaeta souniana]BDR92156.1 hypothetical protein Vsou_12490 [Vulcanisaeta souniana JCM 11219]GGI67528.1 hypothetical protein GCM10007112_00600 [Vulcanisaeta souniana JCM 11219]
MEIIQLIGTSREEVDRVMEVIEWALEELGVPSNDIMVYVTDDHNKVREALGMSTVTHEEWPIKCINVGIDEPVVISVIPSKLLQLEESRMRVILLREVALIKVMRDPVLSSTWSIPQSIDDQVVHRVSLALLKRTIDLVIAQSQSLIQHLINAFNGDEIMRLLSACQPTVDCAITVLALDVPLSIEASGNVGLGRSLWNNLTRGLDNDFTRRYEDFRDFVRNNFNVENTYNYLLMMFRRS